MLKDDLDDDMDAADHPVSYASNARAGILVAGQFRPEDIDLDVSDGGPAVATGMFRPEGIDIDDDVDDIPLAHIGGIGTVVAARAYVATTEEAPGPWPLPPSQTRKRARAKLVAGPAATSSLKPDPQGLWPCSSCSALYASRTDLYGHLRFCPALDAWRCDWCGCGAHHTPHKSSGPAGPKTLCSACSARFRAGHSGPPQQNDAGQYVCEQCDRPFATVAALGGVNGSMGHSNRVPYACTPVGARARGGDLSCGESGIRSHSRLIQFWPSCAPPNRAPALLRRRHVALRMVRMRGRADAGQGPGAGWADDTVRSVLRSVSCRARRSPCPR
jgi:hypothetical protein